MIFACSSADLSGKHVPEGKQGKLESRFLHVFLTCFFVVPPTLRAHQDDARYPFADNSTTETAARSSHHTGYMPGTTVAETGV